MADIVGVDHISMGADQFDAPGCVEDFARWVHRIAGCNSLRIFRAAVG